MIRLDFTRHSVVAVCSLCGWRAGALDRPEGWRLGAAHERRAHPELTQAAKASSSTRRPATR